MSPLADATVKAPAAAPQPLAGPQPPIAPEALPEPLNAVATGQVPAVPVPPLEPGQQPDPVQQFIIENFPALPQVGLGVFEASDLTTIVFNASQVNEETLAQADADGVLPQLLQTLNQPVGAAPAAPAGAAEVAQTRADQRPQMPVQTAPAVPSMPAPKMPAGTANLLAKARVRNLGAGPQTPGIKPAPLSSAVAKRPV